MLPTMRSQPVNAPSTTEDLEITYRQRFSEHDVVAKDSVWKEIATYLQRYLAKDGPVLDVACDHGAFIRHIKACERWATDLRDVSGCMTSDIKFVQADGCQMADSLPHNHFEMVFMSNYLEHLPSAEAVVQQIRQTAPGSQTRRDALDTAAEHSFDGGAVLGTFLTTKHHSPKRALRKPPLSSGSKLNVLSPDFCHIRPSQNSLRALFWLTGICGSHQYGG